MNLYKVYPRSEALEKAGIPSAYWGVEEFPDLVLYQDCEHPRKPNGWMVDWQTEPDNLTQPDPNTDMAVYMLKDQVFHTREEALQALGVIYQQLQERGEEIAREILAHYLQTFRDKKTAA